MPSQQATNTPLSRLSTMIWSNWTLAWWGDNKTTFEPTKVHFILMSNKTLNRFNLCFPFTRIMFDRFPIKRKPAVKLVGYLFDQKLTRSSMIVTNTKKARIWLGALSQFRHLLDDKNIETIYCTFIDQIWNTAQSSTWGHLILIWINWMRCRGLHKGLGGSKSSLCNEGGRQLSLSLV